MEECNDECTCHRCECQLEDQDLVHVAELDGKLAGVCSPCYVVITNTNRPANKPQANPMRPGATA